MCIRDSSRTYTQALLSRLHGLALKTFTRLVAGIDLNCNIQLLQDLHEAKDPLCEVWLRILASDLIVFPVINASTSNEVLPVSVPTVDPFKAAFPFSVAIAPQLQHLIDLRLDLEEWPAVYEYLDSMPIGQVLTALNHRQVQLYLKDLIQIQLPHMPASAHSMPTFVTTVECLATMAAIDTTGSDVKSCFTHVSDAHLALMQVRHVVKYIWSIQAQLMQLSLDSACTVSVFQRFLSKGPPANSAKDTASAKHSALCAAVFEHFQALESQLLSTLTASCKSDSLRQYTTAIALLKRGVSRLLDWMKSHNARIHMELSR
eukprot:TRINITY_DN29897_c0_g1_i1.p1 TRINITY_DN29897_c0_g1~~TRINITY_DN29897_c0_g1_i1.p1  ORF type:complete len:329 (+),score=56.62 TRINITY_DN29897_c0_g1_i1:39-989(+)